MMRNLRVCSLNYFMYNIYQCYLYHVVHYITRTYVIIVSLYYLYHLWHHIKILHYYWPYLSQCTFHPCVANEIKVMISTSEWMHLTSHIQKLYSVAPEYPNSKQWLQEYTSLLKRCTVGECEWLVKLSIS